MIRFFLLAWAIIIMRVVIIIATNVRPDWTLSVGLGAGIPVTWLVTILFTEFYLQFTRQQQLPDLISLNGESLVTFQSWEKVKLVAKNQLSRDVSSFVFELSHSSMQLYVPPGHHILFRCGSGRRAVIRPYTPIDVNQKTGHIEFVIKRYDNGPMSTHLHDTMSVGDCIEMKGPVGTFKLRREDTSTVLMLAGGTGITPLLSVATSILRNPISQVNVYMIVANRTSDDVILMDELNSLSQEFPDRFRVCFTVSRLPLVDWGYESGRISETMIAKYAPKVDDKTQVLICGPRPMCLDMFSLTSKMGYNKTSTFAFGVSDH